MKDKQTIAIFENKDDGILSEVNIVTSGYIVSCEDTDAKRNFGNILYPFGFMDEAIRKAQSIAAGMPL